MSTCEVKKVLSKKNSIWTSFVNVNKRLEEVKLPNVSAFYCHVYPLFVKVTKLYIKIKISGSGPGPVSKEAFKLH